MLRYIMENPLLALANIIAGVGMCVWIERMIGRWARRQKDRR